MSDLRMDEVILITTFSSPVDVVRKLNVRKTLRKYPGPVDIYMLKVNNSNTEQSVKYVQS